MLTPGNVTDDLAAAYARAQAELTRLSVANAELRSRVEELETATLAADLEALRTKAEAVREMWDAEEVGGEPLVGLFAALDALRAELDKPSGASLLAEIASLRAALQREGEQVTLFQGERDHALANADLMSRIADAWKALAKARALSGTKRINAQRAALAALRALGIDPGAT